MNLNLFFGFLFLCLSVWYIISGRVMWARYDTEKTAPNFERNPIVYSLCCGLLATAGITLVLNSPAEFSKITIWCVVWPVASFLVFLVRCAVNKLRP
ncbi:hypothetical protein BH10CYA1_BH10CYA1_03420 [soil metagenome]